MKRASDAPIAAVVASFGVAWLVLGACGYSGGSPTAPAPPPPPTVVRQGANGTARATGPLSCSGDSHEFVAAAGAISVTLNGTTGGVGMAVQVCAGGIDDNACSIPLVPIAVGQTVTGTRRGASGQTLKFNTANCGGGGPAPAEPVNYTATLEYLQ